MMSHPDTAFERLRNANPVPDPTALRERSVTADPTHTETLRSLGASPDPGDGAPSVPESPDRDPNRWVAALVAALVVAMLVVTLQLLTPEAGPTPDEVAEEETTVIDDPTSEASAIESMRTFVESTSPQQVRSVLGPDVVAPGGGDLDEYVELRTGWMPAAGASERLGSCDLSSEEGPMVVRCDTVVEIEWRALAGLDPLVGEYRAVIENGRLAAIEDSVSEDVRREAWDPFLTWLVDTVARRTVEAMVADADALWPPLTTEESLALWEERTGEFRAFIGHEETVRSMIRDIPPELDDDTIEGMFAPEAQFTAASVDSPADWAAWGDYLDAIGIERTEFRCVDGGMLGDIECSFVYTDRIIRALGLTSQPSVVEMWITFDDDGRVLRWAEEVTLSPDAYQGAFGDFWTWLETNHPEDFAGMIDLDNGYDVTLEPDVIALFEQYSQDYVDAITTGADPTP